MATQNAPKTTKTAAAPKTAPDAAPLKGGELVKVDGAFGELVRPDSDKPDPSKLMLNGDELGQLLAQGAWTSEVTLSMSEGDVIAGVYLGPGSPVEMSEPDPQTGEVIKLQTWRVQPFATRDMRELAPVVVSIIGKYQLNRDMAGIPVGTRVAVKHMGKRNHKGGARQLNHFLVWRLPDAADAAPSGS